MKMPGTLKSYAHGLHSRETPKREANGGLGPLVAIDPMEVRRPPKVAKEVAGPRGGGGKVEERVMVLVVVVVVML